MRAAGVADRVDLDAEHGLHVAARRAPPASRRRTRSRRARPRARRARLATPASVSPKYWRRSEWPTSEPAAPSPSSIGAEISPVYAPSSSQWTFCAYVVSPACDAARERDVRRADDRVDAGDAGEPRGELIRIGPGEHLPVAGDHAASTADGIAATPGSSLPSSSSRLAPPPVETHEICRRGRARSARAPSRRRRRRRTPARSLRRRARPRSCPRRTPATRRRPSARSRRSSARPRSLRRTARASPARCRGRASRRAGRRRRRRPTRRPLRTRRRRRRRLGSSTAKLSGFSTRICSAILPPISTVSARPPRFSSTPSLSSTFAPPEISTNGCSTSPSSLPRCFSSSSSSSPAYAGSRCATPSVDACARCADPKASLT